MGRHVAAQRVWGGGRLNEAGGRAIRAVERLLSELGETVRKEAVADCLDKPKDAFGGFKPVELMERGESDRLGRMIYHLGSGEPS